MSKISMMTHLDSVKGKYARTDQVYTKVRKKDQQVIGIRLKNPAKNEPPTAGQKTAQDKLTTVAANVKTAFATPETIAAYKAEFKKQHRFVTLSGYVYHKEFEKLNSQNG